MIVARARPVRHRQRGGGALRPRSAASLSAARCRARGAVGSVILALVADLTREENRTKAMAMVGITIGASFMVALVAGPIVANFVGVAGIFWLMVALALVGIAITQFVVPNPPPPARASRCRGRAGNDRRGAAQQGAVAARFRHIRAARHADRELSGGARPVARHADVPVHDQWMVYLPVLLVSVAVMVPAIIVAEKYRRMKGVFVGAVAALVVEPDRCFISAPAISSSCWRRSSFSSRPST